MRLLWSGWKSSRIEIFMQRDWCAHWDLIASLVRGGLCKYRSSAISDVQHFVAQRAQRKQPSQVAANNNNQHEPRKICGRLRPPPLSAAVQCPFGPLSRCHNKKQAGKKTIKFSVKWTFIYLTRALAPDAKPSFCISWRGRPTAVGFTCGKMENLLIAVR